MKIVIQIILFLFPWFIRRKILILMGYSIDRTAHIGFSIILSHQLIMHENSRIGSFTVCKNIDKLELNKNSKIGALNFITGYSSHLKQYFKNESYRKCEFIIGESSSITSRHFFDVNGGIYIGKFTQIAGIRSTFLTHSIDVYKNIQSASPIKIGDYCFCGSNIIILKGVVIEDYTVIGAGSVIVHSIGAEKVVVAGNPAIIKKHIEIKDVAFFARTQAKVD